MKKKTVGYIVLLKNWKGHAWVASNFSEGQFWWSSDDTAMLISDRKEAGKLIRKSMKTCGENSYDHSICRVVTENQ